MANQGNGYVGEIMSHEAPGFKRNAKRQYGRWLRRQGKVEIEAQLLREELHDAEDRQEIQAAYEAWRLDMEYDWYDWDYREADPYFYLDEGEMAAIREYHQSIEDSYHNNGRRLATRLRVA